MAKGEAMLPRLTHPWYPHAYPYELFVDAGLTPQSSHTDVLDASLAMMGEGKMTPAVRAAFDALSSIPSRLAIDFFLFNPELADPQRVAEDAVKQLARNV